MEAREKMDRKTAIYGGSFNPPGIFHRRVAEALVEHFDLVIILPCGPRPDKPTINDVEPVHRAAMVDKAFEGIDRVELDHSDLERFRFTPTSEINQKYSGRGNLWHVVAADLCRGGASGESEIQRQWHKGREIWHQLQFCVISESSNPIHVGDLPPNNLVINLGEMPHLDSNELRKRIFNYEEFECGLCPKVTTYIKRYGLYKGRLPSRRSLWNVNHPKFLIVADTRNPRALALAEKYRHFEDSENPECILVLGGDGTMLHTIRQNWRRRLPFLGVNQGHLGFLLNDADELLPESISRAELVLRQMPMLYIEIEAPDGTVRTDLAFNDAWIERTTSQSAWIELTVQDQIRIPKMVSDGALVCTAGGSTAYARAMGVAPLLADTPGWMVVGSNVISPAGWKSALLALDSQISLRSLGGEKRPLRAFADGWDLGPAIRFDARLSRTASVEVAFSINHDMAEKISRLQFPGV